MDIKSKKSAEPPIMEILKTDTALEIPAEVAVCPICSGELYAQFDAWVEDGGQWKASEVHLDCENEPDIDSEDWPSWHAGHYSMPYVDWLPICYIVLEWVNKNYSFDLDDG